MFQSTIEREHQFQERDYAQRISFFIKPVSTTSHQITASYVNWIFDDCVFHVMQSADSPTNRIWVK